MGAALHNVAIANLRAGQLDEAVDAIEEAVRIRKLTLGKDSPKVAVSRSFETTTFAMSKKTHPNLSVHRIPLSNMALFSFQ